MQVTYFQFIKHRFINQINTLSSKASIINLPGVLPNLPLIPVQDQVVEEILPGGVVAAFEPEHQLIAAVQGHGELCRRHRLRKGDLRGQVAVGADV